MKAIAVFIVLVALVVGTYLNRKETANTAELRDTVETNLAAPARESALPVLQRTDVGLPTTTNIPL
jgi:hypothetical protein